MALDGNEQDEFAPVKPGEILAEEFLAGCNLSQIRDHEEAIIEDWYEEED